MSHLTKAVSKMTNKIFLMQALTMLDIQYQDSEEGSKTTGKSNYRENENTSVQILLTQFVGNQGHASVGYEKTKDGTFTIQGDTWSLKDKNESRSPKYPVIDKNNKMFNINQVNNQIARFYNVALAQDALKIKGAYLLEDTVKEVSEGKDTVLKFQFETYVNGEQVFINCSSKADVLEYEVQGLMGSGCKDLTGFIDSQLSILSSVDTEEANMELDVEQSHSEFH
jgi:hypothetical protein